MSHKEFERRAFDGVNLYYQVWITDKQPKGVICLIHGLGEHSGRYKQWADWLNRANYSVLTYDLRGHGKSGGKRGHALFDDYISDTDQLLEEAEENFPGTPKFLYGHSLGAIIAWVYCLKRKPEIQGVVLSALDYKNSIAEQKAKLLMVKLLGSVLPNLTISSGLDPNDISKDPEIVTAYITDPLVHKDVTLGWGKSTLDSIDWALKRSREWTLPVLLMHGEKDKLGYVAGSIEFANMIRGDCTLKIWPDLYHEIHNEPQKEEVFKFLRGWLDKHTFM